jgi:lactoylglutathione lyase
MVTFSHVGHCVRDVEVSRAFYVDVLGFEKVMELDVSGSHSAKLLRLPDPIEMLAVYLKRDGFVLELLAFTQPETGSSRERSITEPGLTHLSLGVEDLDATCTAVIAHGGAVLEESRLPSAVFITDPDGQMIELLAGDGFAQRLHG